MAGSNEEYVIDVTINAQDKTSEPLETAQKNVSKYDDAIEQMILTQQKMVKQLVTSTEYLGRLDQSLGSLTNAQVKLSQAFASSQQYISRFDQSLQNLSSTQQKTVAQLQAVQNQVEKLDSAVNKMQQDTESASRTPIVLQALDKATAVMDRVYERGRDIAAKPIELVIKAKDLATAPLSHAMDMLTSYQAFMLAGAVTAVGAASIAWPLQLADNLQQANVAFATMLGSAQKAQQFMNQVQSFAIATPFSTADVVKNAQLMMAMGFSAKSIIPDLQAIGDASSALGGSADTIQRIVLALGQMQQHGKVDAQDMLQLTSVGINGWKMLADKLHLTVAQVQALSQAGKLQAAPAVQTILQGMEKLYNGQMQKNASSTFSGLMSQITDTFKIDIVTKWGQGIEKSVLPALSQFNDWLGKNQTLIAGWGQSLEHDAAQGAQWVVDRVQELASSVNTMVNSPAWQNAPNLWAKMKVGWDSLIVQPFDTWWSGKGKQDVANIAGDVGTFFGSTLNGMIMGALGLINGPTVTAPDITKLPPAEQTYIMHLPPDQQKQALQALTQSNAFVSAGQTAGSAFFNAFVKSFHAGEIAHALIKAFENIQPTFMGGQSNSLGGDIFAGITDFMLLRAGFKGVKSGVDTASTLKGWYKKTRNLFGGGKKPPDGDGPSSSSRGSDSLAEDAARSIQSASTHAGLLSKIRALGSRIPGLDLLFGGIGVADSLRATTRAGKFSGVGGAVGGTAGAIAGGAVGSLADVFLGPLGTIGGSVLGQFVGDFIGKNIGSLLSKIPWETVAKGASEDSGVIVKFFKGAYDSSTSWVGRMVTDIPKEFSKIPDALANVLNSVWSKIASPLQTVSDGVKSIVNGVIGGYNWIASKLGISTIPLWGGITLAATAGASSTSSNSSSSQSVPGFAKGVSDWTGGVAMVGEEGPELVYLPPHSSVLPNHQTRRVVPGFAKGVGDFFGAIGQDFTKLLSSGSSAVVSAALKAVGVQAPSLPDLFSGMGDAMYNNAIAGLTNWVTGHKPSSGSSSGGPPSGVQVPGTVAQWLTEAMKLTGTSLNWLGALEQIAMHESSGNPYAINLWDSNAKAGTPSKGLMQVIDSTFAQYALPGHTDIWNPVDNAAAAIRYMDARYGSIGNVPGIVSLSEGGPYKGYAAGGTIHEPIVGVGLKSGTKYAFGEKGPERITPTGQTMAQQSSGSASVSIGNVTVSVSVEGGSDTDDIVERIKSKAPDIAKELIDEIAYQLSKGLNRTFANMPA
ncbi:hypothetical protein AAC03nite_20110 [Alicyclobacillus acidoterrestris]|nr:hypothetical protein AAC03nite_20110 [Alicyclobacillus acidoterrestris]